MKQPALIEKYDDKWFMLTTSPVKGKYQLWTINVYWEHSTPRYTDMVSHNGSPNLSHVKDVLSKIDNVDGRSLRLQPVIAKTPSDWVQNKGVRGSAADPAPWKHRVRFPAIEVYGRWLAYESRYHVHYQKDGYTDKALTDGQIGWLNKSFDSEIKWFLHNERSGNGRVLADCKAMAREELVGSVMRSCAKARIALQSAMEAVSEIGAEIESRDHLIANGESV